MTDTLKNNSELNAIKTLQFAKRDGAVEIGGHLYEIYLCMLMLLKKEETHVDEIYLASNAEIGADFDDVLLKIKYDDGKSRVIFLQAKHKKNPQKAPRVSFDLLLSDSKDFSLKKYFKSYRTIRDSFREGRPDDPVLSSDFDDCELVLYTNLIPHERFSECNDNVRRVPVGSDNFLNFQGENCYYQLRLEGTDQTKQKIRRALNGAEDHEIDDFLNKFKLFIDQPNKDQLELIIKSKLESIYKIVSNKVIDVFSSIEYKICKWWEKDDYYLTKSNSYFEESATIDVFNVKPPVELFTGRNRELSELHRTIYQNPLKPIVITQKVVRDSGGIGKSELAKKYAYEYSTYYDNNVLWINADNDDMLKDSFFTLARDKLQITTTGDGSDKNICSVVEELYNFFSRRNRKCMIIFDNADRPELLYKFLPLNCLKSEDKKPFVLITSRSSQWDNGIEILPLDQWEPEEAEEFLNKSLRGQDCAIPQLATKLQRFPFALQQAAAYINAERAIFNANYTVSDYLRQYDLHNHKSVFQGTNEYIKTASTTWMISVDRIATDEEVGVSTLELFKTLAYCAPEDIPIKMFLQLTNNDETQLKRGIHLMEKYSLLKSDKKLFYIHRLVQEVTRLNLRYRQAEKAALKTLLDVLEKDVSKDNIKHAMSAWEYSHESKELMVDYFLLWDHVINQLQLRKMTEKAQSLAETLNRNMENSNNIATELKVKSQQLVASFMKDKEVRRVRDDLKKIEGKTRRFWKRF